MVVAWTTTLEHAHVNNRQVYCLYCQISHGFYFVPDNYHCNIIKRGLIVEQNTEVSAAWAVNSTSDDRQLQGALRSDEIVLLTIALTIWVMSIIMFVRRWTRLRVLEPLQVS